MKRTDLTQEFVGNVGWQAAITGSGLVIKAALLILLARYIAPAQFGLFAAATVVASLAADFSQMGVHRALVQRAEISVLHECSAFAISLLTGFAATMALILAAPQLAAIFRLAEATQFIRFLALTLLFTGMAAVSASLLQRERRFRALGAADLSSYVFGFACVALPMAIMGYGAWALAIGQMAQTATRSAVLLGIRRPVWAIFPHLAESIALLRSGLGFSAGQIGNYLATQVDYIVVGRGLGAEALGFYNRAYQFLLLPAQVFGTVTSTVLFPTMATIQDQGERVARAYCRALGVIALLTLPVGGTLAVIAPELVRFLLGSPWEGMIVPFQVLIATLVFRTSYKISDAVTLAMGGMYRRAVRQFAYAAAVAGGAWLGLPYGLAGVAAGVGVAVLLNHVLMANLACEVLGISPKGVWMAQAAQLPAAFLTVLPVWAAVASARDAGWSNGAIVAAGLSAGLIAFAALWFGLRRIYGSQGEWLAAIASERLASFRRKPRARGN